MKNIILKVHIKLSKLIAIGIIILIFIIPIIISGMSSKNNVDITSQEEIAQFSLDDSNIKVSNKQLVVGKVKVFITKENKIEEMNVEDYVQGVVCGEMPITFELEALKAQAIAARTYTLAHMTSLGGSGCSKNKDADLCDTIHCQVYESKEEKMKEWPADEKDALWAKVSEAVNSTTGKILTYNNQLVASPLYFSMSSGKTYDSAEIFSDSRPYLKSVDSPGESDLKDFKSTIKLNRTKIVSIINNVYPNAKVTTSNLKNQVKILQRGSANEVVKIKVGNIILTGNQFRTALELKSPDFNIDFNKNSVDITCLGSGHGVGMSQWGANIMAQKGYNYVNILTHYYQGVNIDSVKYN